MASSKTVTVTIRIKREVHETITRKFSKAVCCPNLNTYIADRLEYDVMRKHGGVR